MKILYIESELKNQEFNLSESDINKLPKKIFLAYSIQYRELALKIKKQLEKNNIKITQFQQVLGCSKINTKEPVLLIGTGEFHAMNLFLQVPAVYIIADNQIKQIPSSKIDSLRAKRKSSLIKYLNATNIGILVSTKPGQEQLGKAIKLKERLKKKGKQAYIFLSNNININEFENFGINSWVNTACPGLSFDNPDIINYNELSNLSS